MDALLKTDANGNLTKITLSEEDYLAYQIGLKYAADTSGSESGSLTTNVSGTNIGAYTNTVYDNNVGETGLDITTTSSTLYQRTPSGTPVAEDGADFAKPVIYDRSGTGAVVALKAANDTEFNTIVDRLMLKTFANEYPGCRRLATSTPGSDWTNVRSNLFTDTRTDGTSINYHIWMKTSGTAPSKVSPQMLHNTFDLKSMDTANIQYTFGQRAKTRGFSTGVGNYKLLASGDSLPAGTWVAKGAATDTRQAVADADYTRTSTGNYLGNYTGNYIGNYLGNYDGAFSGANFEGNYTRTSTRTSQRTSTRDSTDDFTGNFVGNYEADYLATYTGNYEPNYEGNFEGNFEGASDFTRVRDETFAGYIGNQFTGNYTGGLSYEGIYTRDSTRAFASSTANFLGDYEGNYVGDYISSSGVAYTGASFTRNSSGAEYAGTPGFTRDSTAVFTGNFAGNFVGDYTGNYVGNYGVDYEGTYEGQFTRTSTRDSTRDSQRTSTSDYTGNYIASTIQAGNVTIETYTLYLRTA